MCWPGVPAAVLKSSWLASPALVAPLLVQLNKPYQPVVPYLRLRRP